jgi:hypothetical protein
VVANATTIVVANATIIVLANATTTVLPPGTNTTIVADDTTADAAAEETVTGDSEVTATVVDDTLETSTIIIVDNGTDVFTSIKPGNGHGADDDEASNDTVTVVNETIAADNETTTDVSDVTDSDILETTTIGTGYIILISNGMVCARQYQKNDKPFFFFCLLVCISCMC